MFELSGFLWNFLFCRAGSKALISIKFLHLIADAVLSWCHTGFLSELFAKVALRYESQIGFGHQAAGQRN